MIETLITGCMMPSRTNSPPVEVSTQMYHTASNQCFYHWVDTSTGGLLVLEDIIHPVVYRPGDRNTDYWVYDTLED
jgi:hypothetical protein